LPKVKKNRRAVNPAAFDFLGQRGLNPILVSGGMTVPVPVLDDAGEPVMRDAPIYGMYSCAARVRHYGSRTA